MNFRIVGVAALLIASTTSALPAPNFSDLRLHLKRSAAPFITPKGPTLAPMGHVVFCLEKPSECRIPRRRSARIELTDARLAQLAEVNRSVNRSITPVNDRKRGAFTDTWTLEPASGDCEDFVLTKRHRLIAMGWPASQLRIAIGRTSSGEGHAVLVVRTKSGDLVLDNRSDSILSWQKTNLQFAAIQTGRDPRFWHRI